MASYSHLISASALAKPNNLSVFVESHFFNYREPLEFMAQQILTVARSILLEKSLADASATLLCACP